MILRVIRALLGKSRRDALARAEADQHREEHEAHMRAVHMKVEALQSGAERMKEERRKTEAAAHALLVRLQQDFPQ